MYQIGDVLISAEVLTERFICDLKECMGACCIEGDAGAPLELDEVLEIEELLPIIWEQLSIPARKVINKQGVAYTDPEGQLVTSIVNGKDCVFTCYDEKGACFCAIEKAYREGKVSFMKPISCHLYPIRVRKIGECWGLNYDRWDVCSAARIKGQREHTPVYRHLKEPLIRRFGKEWYDELELTVEEMKRQNII